MTSKAQKLLDKLRKNRRNWSCGDLTTILKGTGFEWRDSKHRVFHHSEFPDLGSYPIPRSDELAPDYAKHVLRCVEEALARYKAREESEK